MANSDDSRSPTQHIADKVVADRLKEIEAQRPLLERLKDHWQTIALVIAGLVVLLGIQQMNTMKELVVAADERSAVAERLVKDIEQRVAGFEETWATRITELKLLRNAQPADEYAKALAASNARDIDQKTVDKNGFRFLLKSCSKTNRRVQCSVGIENLLPDTQGFNLYASYAQKTTNLVDESGKSYPAKEVTFTGQTTAGVINGQLAPGLMQNAEFVFEDVNPSAQFASIQLLMGNMQGNYFPIVVKETPIVTAQ